MSSSWREMLDVPLEQSPQSSSSLSSPSDVCTSKQTNTNSTHKKP